MKIVIIGHTLTVRDKETGKRVTHEPGQTFDIDDKEAESLIALGFAKKAGVAQGAPADKPPETKTKVTGGN